MIKKDAGNRQAGLVQGENEREEEIIWCNCASGACRHAGACGGGHSRLCNRKRQHALRPEHRISRGCGDTGRRALGHLWLPFRHAMVRRFIQPWTWLGSGPLCSGRISPEPRLCRTTLLPRSGRSDHHLRCRYLLGSLLSRP